MHQRCSAWFTPDYPGQLDLFLQIILDTKYKPRWGNIATDQKKGVSQADMYQMISYAYKRGTDKVLMIYPNSSDRLADDYVLMSTALVSLSSESAEVIFY